MALAGEPPDVVELADADQPVCDSAVVKPTATFTLVNVAVFRALLLYAVTANPAWAVVPMAMAVVPPTCVQWVPSVL